MFYCFARSNRQTTAIPNISIFNSNEPEFRKKKGLLFGGSATNIPQVANIPQDIL